MKRSKKVSKSSKHVSVRKLKSSTSAQIKTPMKRMGKENSKGGSGNKQKLIKKPIEPPVTTPCTTALWVPPVYLPVLSKADFARRYKEGEFGNASPTWDTVDEFCKSDRNGIFHLRNRRSGGPTLYNTNWHEIVDVAASMPEEDFYVSEMAPHHLGTIQGEVSATPEGLYLMWTWAKKPMRESLADTRFHYLGLETVLILQHYFNPLSFDWLLVLLDRYPDHVVEFSCFSQNWGTLPRYNVVFWEVRKY